MNEHHLMRIFFSAALFTGFCSYAVAQPARTFHPGSINPQTLQKHDASKHGQGKNKPVNPGIIRGFNPQPEPPGHSANAIIDDNTKGGTANPSGHGAPENPGTIRGFNPQPEPPGHSANAIIDDNTKGGTAGHSANAIIDDNTKGGTANPSGHGAPENPGTTHGFNPQPEPPG